MWLEHSHGEMRSNRAGSLGYSEDFGIYVLQVSGKDFEQRNVSWHNSCFNWLLIWNYIEGGKGNMKAMRRIWNNQEERWWFAQVLAMEVISSSRILNTVWKQSQYDFLTNWMHSWYFLRWRTLLEKGVTGIWLWTFKFEVQRDNRNCISEPEIQELFNW